MTSAPEENENSGSTVLPLIAFDAGQGLADQISLSGQIQISQGIIGMRFVLNDPHHHIKKPESNQNLVGERRDGLWQTTCFELFLSPEGQADYFEINVSPLGHWNSYHFKNYRSPQPPELTSSLIVESINWKDGALSVEIQINDETLHQVVWDGSLTAVLEKNNGEKIYMATAHVGPKPDFHLRDSFKLKRGYK